MEKNPKQQLTGKLRKPEKIGGIARNPVNYDSEVEFSVQPGKIGEGKSLDQLYYLATSRS